MPLKILIILSCKYKIILNEFINRAVENINCSKSSATHKTLLEGLCYIYRLYCDMPIDVLVMVAGYNDRRHCAMPIDVLVMVTSCNDRLYCDMPIDVLVMVIGCDDRLHWAMPIDVLVMVTCCNDRQYPVMPIIDTLLCVETVLGYSDRHCRIQSEDIVNKTL